MTVSPQAPSLGGLALATMFRGDPRQLVQWCNIHLNKGADRLYVVLDRPAAEQVDALPQDARIHWEVLGEEVWKHFYPAGRDNVERKQVDAIRWVMSRAIEEGRRHVAFVDTDEILDLAVPFADIVAQYPDAPALTVPVREMWFRRGAVPDEPFGATLALGWDPSHISVWNRLFGWRAQYFRNGRLGHEAGKTIYSLPLASGRITVHGPQSGVLRARGVTLPDDVARLLHFDSGSLAAWNHKWTARILGDALAHGLGGHRRAQLRLFTHELRRSPAEQQRFFEWFFSLDQTMVSALDSIGVLDRVDVTALANGPHEVPAGRDEAIVQLPGVSERVDYQYAMVCDQNFVKPTFATLVSVLAQTDPAARIRFVILGDGLAESDVNYFKSLERTDYHLEVQVHDVTADLDRDVGQDLHRRSRATYGRVYLVDLLPEQRTVYLDGDVLATRDISELFSLDLGGACIAGVPDSAALRMVSDPSGVPIAQRMRLAGIAGADPLEYLNAGVLVLDLDNPDYRELALRSRGHVANEGRALAQHDQDAINLAFRGRKHRLPSTYNYMTQFYTSERTLGGDLIALKYAAADASLIHFSGKVKPWIANEDEFYNALYRRIVLAAEERVGVSCGFYFSKRTPPQYGEWSVERWVERLGSRTPPATPTGAELDAELVDLTDTACYVRFAVDTYMQAVRARLRLVARIWTGAGYTTLFEIPVDRFGPQQAHLMNRVGIGVRSAFIDLPAILAPFGGLVRRVEVLLVSPDHPSGFERSLGVVEVLGTAESVSPDLLGELAIEAKLERVENGVLSGWYRSDTEEQIAMHFGSELVAIRGKVKEEDGARIVRFRVKDLVRRYGHDGDDRSISVRVASTNVPFPGMSLTVAGVRAESRAPQGAGAPAPDSGKAVGGPWSASSTGVARAGARLVGRVRRRLGRRGGPGA